MPKIWNLRLLVVVIGILSSNFAFAQQPKTIDGNFLKQGTDAWNRVHVTKNASSSDHLMATSILFYVLGVFDVHRHNNFVGALMVNDAFQRLEREATKLNAKEIYEIQAKTISSFIPLLFLPENLPPQQMMAILQKYLDAHPEKWGWQAHLLIVETFAEAFPSNKAQ